MQWTWVDFLKILTFFVFRYWTREGGVSWFEQNLHYIQYTAFFRLLNYWYNYLVHWFLKNPHFNLGLSKKKPLIHLPYYKEKSVYLCAYWFVWPSLRWHSKAKATIQPEGSRVLGFNLIILICFIHPPNIFSAKHGQFDYFFMRWNGASYGGSVLH